MTEKTKKILEEKLMKAQLRHHPIFGKVQLVEDALVPKELKKNFPYIARVRFLEGSQAGTIGDVRKNNLSKLA